MENKNICYIDYLDSYLDVSKAKIPKCLRKIIYFILNFIGYIKKEKNLFILYCVENDKVNDKMLENLIDKIKESDYKAIVLADKIFNNKKILEILKNINVKILDGCMLNKFLALDVLEKIAYIQNKDLKNVEISILTNNDSDFNIENIKLLSQKCKIINIITNKMKQFSVVEKYIFDEFGNIINVSRNKKKGCMHSDMVLNFDYDVSEIAECNFKKNTILVQFTKEEFENRTGITIISYKLKFPIKYLKKFEELKHFNEEIIYESYLYYKNSFENMRKILKEDNIYIKYFIGNNGKIPFRDLKCL